MKIIETKNGTNKNCRYLRTQPTFDYAKHTLNRTVRGQNLVFSVTQDASQVHCNAVKHDLKRAYTFSPSTKHFKLFFKYTKIQPRGHLSNLKSKI